MSYLFHSFIVHTVTNAMPIPTPPTIAKVKQNKNKIKSYGACKNKFTCLIFNGFETFIVAAS
jgi:hypothetical protein